MSDILCRWLNSELRLSKLVEPHSFAKDFANGYLIGEVLSKHQLQDDFDQFSKHSTANAKLNNFTRLEPTLQLLGVPFDLNMAKAVMQGQHGAATGLLYQLYILLQKKKRSGLTGTALEAMQPAATARLHRIENHIYAERLRTVVKREADEKMQKIIDRFERKGQDMYNRSVMAEFVKEEKQRHLLEEMRLQDIEKHRQARRKQQEIMDRIQTAAVQIPKPPVRRQVRALGKQQHKQQQEAQNVLQQITQFEKNRKRLSPASYGPTAFSVQHLNEEEAAQWNNDYVQRIRQRLEEDVMARDQREKRRRRALIQQLQAHQSYEEMLREEQLVGRLVRQSQQEKRIAVQLMQIRRQKEVVRENRILRERQYEEQRLREFREALDKEAALLQEARKDRQEELRKERELHVQLATERAQSRYRKHRDICRGILEHIVDLATKAGQYRLLTDNVIPAKLLREWKELFFSGKPLYEVEITEDPSPEQAVELEKLHILNEQDYDEYTNMRGEWAWPEEGENKAPPSNNDILGHVVARLQNIVNPPKESGPPPLFLHFTLRACVLGKLCSGKTTCLTRISKAHGIQVLTADTLIQEVLAAHQAGEQASFDESLEPEKSARSNGSPPQEADQRDMEEQSFISDSGLQPADLPKKDNKAYHGAKVEKALKSGKAVPDDLLVDIFIDAIRQIPPGQSWILDGFPVDINQVQLLEKALGGVDPDEVEKTRENERYNLVMDRNAPKAPPPYSPTLNLAVLLEVSDERVLERAIRQSSDQARDSADNCSKAVKETQEPAHPEHSQQSAFPSGEEQENLEKRQIQHRIMGFQDAWPRLEKWFGEKQNGLVKVNADVDEDALFREVDTVLFSALTAAEKGSRRATDCTEAAEDDVKVTEDFISQIAPQPVESEHAEAPSSETSFSLLSVEAPSLLPGSAGWVYMDEPLPKEIPEYLVPHWENMCKSYVVNVQTVLQNLRSERDHIMHHLYHIREDFKQYLQRPDLKQDFVSAWQRDYNSVPDDMRQDEETRAELHQRLDELRERLWDICDKRKEEAMQERAGIIGDGWLEDHTALLINHYSSLMHTEVDRFQETLLLLRDYYSGMCSAMLPETAPTFTPMPLLDFPEDNGNQPEGTQRVTITRRPSSSDPSRLKDLNTSPHQPDEQLLQDIYHTALTAITNMVSVEFKEMELEENEELQQHRQSQASVSASNSARDKKKAAKKKGPPSPTQEPSPPPVIEETEMQKRAVNNRIRQEYHAALQHEVDAVRQRLELLKLYALATVQNLLQRTQLAHTDMEEWLSARFLSEINSIDQLAEVVRHHVENAEQIGHELVLACTDFFIDGDTRVTDPPPASPCPPPLEQTDGSTLTVLQLQGLQSQLCKIAPTGLMSSNELCERLKDLTSHDMGSNALPETWMHLTDPQIHKLVCLLAQDRELVDWRQFLLGAAVPWPLPSQIQLLNTLKDFRAIDTADTGVVSLEQYLQVDLWFSNDHDLTVPNDLNEPLPYDRLTQLRKFFFTLFADPGSSPAVLDYQNMLLYFCCHRDPAQGFIRALSLVTQQTLHFTRISPLLQSVTNMDAAEYKECNVEEKEDKCVNDNTVVSMEEVLKVLSHGGARVSSHHRLYPNCKSKEEIQKELMEVFQELGFTAEEKIPFSVLSQHPFLQDTIEGSLQYLLLDINRVLQIQQSSEESSSTAS